MKKLLALVLAVVMVLSLFAACAENEPAPEAGTDGPKATSGKTPEADPEADDNSVVNMRLVMLNSTKTALRPPMNFSHMELQLLYETPLRYDVNKNEYINVLAESYSYTSDGLTHTLVLKDGITFHDGHPITAEDVLYTYNLNVQAAQPYANYLSTLKGYDAVVAGEAEEMTGMYATDDKTIVFEFNSPKFDLERVLANGCYGILPAHLLSEKTWSEVLEYEAFWAKPVGSGPYKVVETNYPNYIVLERHEDYIMGVPGIKTIVMTAYEGDSVNTAGMAGECDLIRQVSAPNAAIINEANPNMKLTVCNAAYLRSLILNLSEGGRDDLKNPKVRQAINMIIDKQMLVDYLGVLCTVATTPSSGSEYNTDIPTWRRDVDTAKQILKDEGFDFDTPLKLYCSYTDQESIDVMDMLVAMLAEAGITAEYYVDDKNAGQILYTTLDFDMYYGGGGSPGVGNYGYVKNGAVYDVWFTSAMHAQKNTRYVELITAFETTGDATLKTQILDQLQVNYMEDMYTIPLFFMNTGWMMADSFRGFTPYSVDYALFAYIDAPNWSIAE